jgi:hypothetical protein
MGDGFRPKRSGNVAWSSRTRRCAQRNYDPPAPKWKGKDTATLGGQGAHPARALPLSAVTGALRHLFAIWYKNTFLFWLNPPQSTLIELNFQ